MAARRQDVPVMVPHNQAWSISLTKHMQIASNRQGFDCFMPSWLQKIYWSMVQMYQTCLSRDFSFGLTVHSTNGEQLIFNGPLYPRITSFWYYQPCKATRNNLPLVKARWCNPLRPWPHPHCPRAMSIFRYNWWKRNYFQMTSQWLCNYGSWQVYHWNFLIC